LQAETARLNENKAVLETKLELEKTQFEEKLALLKESKAELSLQFKNLANEIFDDKSKRFEERNKVALSGLLNPLQEKIKTFEKRVEDSYNAEARERFSLSNDLKKLHELNDRLGVEAANLVNALKGDNKSQGNWGEMILTTLLERSGLTKGKEYEVQVSLNSQDGARLQPDVVVHMPEGRDIIIDSKVSLKAWEAFTSADDAAERESHIKAHVQSIRSHVRGLSAKSYQNLVGVNTLDYVFLFMPIEAAYSVAIQQDPDLNQDAFERNVIFVGPATLLTTLKTVQNLWRFEQQNQNAKQIAESAGKLYDKFVGFSEDIEELGKKMEAANTSYDKAYNKLKSGRGNLISRTEKLRLLGAKTAKQHKTAVLQEALADEDDSSELLSSLNEEQDSDEP
jgi:DNA recombination protein RmuC